MSKSKPAKAKLTAAQQALKCCGTCAFFGKHSYGGGHWCKKASRVKKPRGWPSSVRIDARMMRPEEGLDCPQYHPAPSGKEGE